jgi:hypothetical protein
MRKSKIIILYLIIALIINNCAYIPNPRFPFLNQVGDVVYFYNVNVKTSIELSENSVFYISGIDPFGIFTIIRDYLIDKGYKAQTVIDQNNIPEQLTDQKIEEYIIKYTYSYVDNRNFTNISIQIFDLNNNELVVEGRLNKKQNPIGQPRDITENLMDAIYGQITGQQLNYITPELSRVRMFFYNMGAIITLILVTVLLIECGKSNDCRELL